MLCQGYNCRYIPQERFDPDGDAKLLRDMARVLRPRGALVGMVFVKRGGTVLPIGFQRARDVDAFRELIRDAGFNLVEERYFDGRTLDPKPAEAVSAAVPRHTRPSEGFSDRLVFLAERHQLTH